jgi:hypothetical protein
MACSKTETKGMHVPPHQLSSGRQLFEQLQAKRALEGVPQMPIAAERQQMPGFMLDRVDVLKDLKASPDNQAAEPDGLLLKRPGFAMSGSIKGDKENGQFQVATTQMDRAGNVQSETLDHQEISNGQVVHYLVHMNHERISALVEHVDRHNPGNSWMQMQEWNLSH